MHYRRKVVGILMGLLVFLVSVQLSMAGRVVKPNEGDILPGPFEEWRVESVYLHAHAYGGSR